MKKTTENYNILVINPGSTSTKLAVFRGRAPVKALTVFHPAPLPPHRMLRDVCSFVKSSGIRRLSAVVARGGLLRPIRSGVYRVNNRMLRDLKQARYGRHASNLGAPCAAAVSCMFGLPKAI